MSSITQRIHPDVLAVNLQMGTLPHPALKKLSADELKVILAEREAEFARVKDQHGDFTGKVREGKWDDGQVQIKGEPLFTAGIDTALVEMGFTMTDVYVVDIEKNGVTKPQTFVVMAKGLPPTARVTDEAKAAVASMLARNWYQAYVWYNPLHTIPNITINMFGDLRKGTAKTLVLTSDKPAEANQA